jgi:DNA-binding beta-propeller fold protein YncE
MLATVLLSALAVTVQNTNADDEGNYLSPLALVAGPRGKTLFVAEFTAKQVAVFDVTKGTITNVIPVPDPPSGLAIARDGSRLYVTGASPAGM